MQKICPVCHHASCYNKKGKRHCPVIGCKCPGQDPNSYKTGR